MIYENTHSRTETQSQAQIASAQTAGMSALRKHDASAGLLRQGWTWRLVMEVSYENTHC